MAKDNKNGLSAEMISHFCPHFSGSVIIKPVLPSTQTFAKQYLADHSLVNELVVIANQQSAGYGKQGRHFYSPADSGLYMSIVLPHKSLGELQKNGLFTTGIGVALVNTLQDFYPTLSFQLKWVNDVYLHNKKIAGILCEASYQFREQSYCYIVGIGLNINTAVFPNELKPKAGAITSAMVDRNRLVARLITNILDVNAHYQDGRFLNQHQQQSFLKDRHVRLKTNTGNLEGLVCGIDKHARLIIQTPAGDFHHLSGGEVIKVYY